MTPDEVHQFLTHNHQVVRSPSPLLDRPAYLSGHSCPHLKDVQTQLSGIRAQHKLYALAAPQIGLPYRLVLYYRSRTVLLYNPEVLDSAEVTRDKYEHCPCFPDQLFRIERPRWIVVKYLQESYVTATMRVKGQAARELHRAIDYLNGITPKQRAKGYIQESRKC